MPLVSFLYISKKNVVGIMLQNESVVEDVLFML